MTADDQWSLGFALAAMTHAFSDPVKPHALAEHVDNLLARIGQHETPLSLPVIAASRSELNAAFRAQRGGDGVVAWEVRPFKHTPFLRLMNGDLLLLSPSWLLSWLGEGFHYRALTQAQREGKEIGARYTRLVGEAVERYALDLAEVAVAAPDRVFGEQPYGRNGSKKTTDVAIVTGCGRDLVLFEVHARRVAATAAAVGSAAEATMEVSKLLVVKADQIGPCVAALLDERAALPGIDINQIERIWPVVVSVGHLMQTRNLWDYLRESMDDTKAEALSDDRVQSLQLMNIEDFEKLMGLVEAGESLPAMLAHKVNGPYRERDFAAWLHSPGAPSDRARLTLLQQRWHDLTDRVIRVSDETARASANCEDCAPHAS